MHPVELIVELQQVLLMLYFAVILLHQCLAYWI